MLASPEARRRHRHGSWTLRGTRDRPLTARQQRILDFIATTVRERGYPPTVREIGEAVGLTSSSSVHAQLANLERRGLLTKDPTKPRAMALSDSPTGAEGVVVPLLGRIAAGHPGARRPERRGPPRGPDGVRRRRRALRAEGHGRLDGRRRHPRRRRRDRPARTRPRTATWSRRCCPGPAEDEATVKRLRRQRGKVVLVPGEPRDGAVRDGSGGPDPGQGRRGPAQAVALARLTASSRPRVRPEVTRPTPRSNDRSGPSPSSSRPSSPSRSLTSAVDRLRDANRIWLVGTGTSHMRRSSAR